MTTLLTLKPILLRVVQVVLLLVSLAVIAFLLLEPQVEGRNANASQLEIYFQDPFLAYAYVASIPFFIGVFQAIGMLRFAERSGIIAIRTMQSLQTIKRCALAFSCFAVVGVFIILMNESDDHAGGVAIGMLVLTGGLTIAIAAAVFQSYVKRKLKMVTA